MLLLLLLLWGAKGVEGEKDALEGYSLNVKREIVVQEGLCVLVPCEFTAKKEWNDSDPIRGYWFRYGEKREKDTPVATYNPERPVLKRTQGRFSLLGDPGKNNCSLGITDIRKEDAGSYFFRIDRGKSKFNYLRNMMTLHVTALTETPHILIPETLEAGRPSNLTCSAPWTCVSPTFSWTGASVSALSPDTTGSSVLTVIPQPWDHGTDVTCQVTLPGSGVTTRTTTRLNVLYAPRNVTVTVYGGADKENKVLGNSSCHPVSEGQSLHFLCSTDSNPPATLSWTWNNMSLFSLNRSAPGLMKLFLVPLQHEEMYTCQARNALGSKHVFLRLCPQRNPTLSEMTLGAFVGAGTTTLLFLFCCIVFLAVRSYGRRPARPAVEAADPTALKGSASQSPLVESQANGSSEPLPPTAKAPRSSTEEEVYYASINFHELKPKSQEQQDTTEYSEIKSHK